MTPTSPSSSTVALIGPVVIVSTNRHPPSHPITASNISPNDGATNNTRW
jgi:hypothetical protein